MEASTGNTAASPGDKLLGEGDCYDVVRELEAVAHRWYNIGLALGLTDSILERIKMKEQTDVHVLLTKTIVEWLKMNHDINRFGQPTWRRIVEAVRAKCGGGNPALADALAKKYSVVLQVVEPVANAAPTHVSIERSLEVGMTRGYICCGYTFHVTRRHSQAPDVKNQTSDSKCEPVKMIIEDVGGKSDPSRKLQPLIINNICPPKSKHYEYRSQSLSDRWSTIVEEYDDSSLLQNADGGSKHISNATPTWQIKDITQERSYWGPMTGAEAELKLRIHGDCCYLIRYSETRKHYVISVMGRKRQRGPLVPHHFKLNVMKMDTHNVFEIEDTEEKFDNISSLLVFYQQHPVSHSVCSIGEACIKK